MPQAQESSPVIPDSDPEALRPAEVLCGLADHTAPESGPGDVLGAQRGGAERKSSVPGRTPGTARKPTSTPALSRALS